MLNPRETLENPNRHLVLSLDFDGCLDTEASQEKLIEFIIQYCKQKPQYQTIAIAIGSLRQSVFTDFHNAAIYYEDRGGNYVSCSQLLNTFTASLALRLEAEFKDAAPAIKKINMLNADLFNRLPIGTTLQYMDSNIYHQFMHQHEIHSIQIQDGYGHSISTYSQQAFETWYEDLKMLHDNESLECFLRGWGLELTDLEDYAEWRQGLPNHHVTITNNDGEAITLLEVDAFQYYSKGNSIHYDDCSKHTQLYNLYHYLYSQMKVSFDLLHFDDVQSILNDFEQYASSHPNFLPVNCSFQGVDWCSHTHYTVPSMLARPVIYGHGPFNENYAEDTRQIALKLSRDRFSYEILKKELSNLCEDSQELASIPPSPYLSTTLGGRYVPLLQGVVRPTPIKGSKAPLINWEAEELGLSLDR